MHSCLRASERPPNVLASVEASLQQYMLRRDVYLLEFVCILLLAVRMRRLRQA